MVVIAILILGQNDLACALARRSCYREALIEEEERTAREEGGGGKDTQEEVANHIG